MRFRFLEMPSHPGTDQVIMLPRLARVGQRQLRSARPKVPNLGAKAEVTEARAKWPYIDSQSALQHARSR